MYEARVRPRQVMCIFLVFCFLLYVVHKRSAGNCVSPENLSSNEPTIYAVTPTYTRPEQRAELTRLSHLFMLTHNLYWIIVEDSEVQTQLVKNLLIESQLDKRSTVLNVKTPDQFKLKGKDPNWKKPRGAEQRNLALEWIREHADPSKRSMVFFMDDDNTYTVELFREIAKIEEGHVGVWPVGLVGGLMVEKPILNENNQVIGFNAAWRPERPFPIDMAGFAISTDLLLKFNKAVFSYNVERGYQESEILRQITSREDLQPLANLCTKVLVWHTRTEKTKLVYEEKLIKNNQPRSDQGIEV